MDPNSSFIVAVVLTFGVHNTVIRTGQHHQIPTEPDRADYKLINFRHLLHLVNIDPTLCSPSSCL